MSLHQGDIIYADFPDPNGQPCATPHPAMILTRTDRILAVNTIWVAAISTQYTKPLPDGWKELQYRSKPNPPHPTTGLWKPCVLKCDWREPVEKTKIIQELGRVPLDVLEWALAWVKVDVERLKRERGH